MLIECPKCGNIAEAEKTNFCQTCGYAFDEEYKKRHQFSKHSSRPSLHDNVDVGCIAATKTEEEKELLWSTIKAELGKHDGIGFYRLGDARITTSRVARVIGDELEKDLFLTDAGKNRAKQKAGGVISDILFGKTVTDKQIKAALGDDLGSSVVAALETNGVLTDHKINVDATASAVRKNLYPSLLSVLDVQMSENHRLLKNGAISKDVFDSRDAAMDELAAKIKNGGPLDVSVSDFKKAGFTDAVLKKCGIIEEDIEDRKESTGKNVRTGRSRTSRGKAPAHAKTVQKSSGSGTGCANRSRGLGLMDTIESYAHPLAYAYIALFLLLYFGAGVDDLPGGKHYEPQYTDPPKHYKVVKYKDLREPSGFKTVIEEEGPTSWQIFVDKMAGLLYIVEIEVLVGVVVGAIIGIFTSLRVVCYYWCFPEKYREWERIEMQEDSPFLPKGAKGRQKHQNRRKANK